MQIKIEVKKRHLYFITTLAIFLFGVILVVAFNYPDSPSVMGHTVGEIENFNTTVRMIVSEVLLGDIICPDTPIYNSMVGNNVTYRSPGNLFEAKTMPVECASETGCIIKQEIYDSRGLYAVKQYTYSQTSLNSNNKWWSSYVTSGAYTNGDTINGMYITQNYKYQYIYDDSAAEKLPTQWSFKDWHTSYGMKVYVCLEG